MANDHGTEDLVAKKAAALGAEPVNAIPYHMNGNEYVVRDVFGGLTKREAFAMVAMQGIIASLDSMVPADNVARVSVLMADALLKELAK